MVAAGRSGAAVDVVCAWPGAGGAVAAIGGAGVAAAAVSCTRGCATCVACVRTLCRRTATVCGAGWAGVGRVAADGRGAA